MTVSINDNFKYKQSITSQEIAQIIGNTDGIARKDLILATSSKMVKPLKTIEATKTFKWRKMAGIATRPVKVYFADRATYSCVIANHFRALATHALRQSGFKIAQPLMLNKGEWGINLAIREDTVLPLETVVVNSKNYTELKGVKVRKRFVPLYVFTDISFFEKVQAEGLLFGESICVVAGKQDVSLHVMNYLGKTEPLYALAQLDEFEKVQHDKKVLVDEILESYDLKKFTTRKKVRKIQLGSD